MGHHGHAHDHHGHGGRRALGIALVLTLLLGAIQVGGSVLFGSVALIADAIHNLSDVAAIGLALGAAWLAGFPARGARTYGLRRAEILAALVNALFLIVLSGWIAWEAVGRLLDPSRVDGGGVALIGLIAIVLNGIPVIILLRSGGRDNVNLRATVLHLGADVLSSFAALAAGIVILLTGWERADPIAALAVAALIVLGSVGIVRDTVRVLLEVAPSGVDCDEIGQSLAAVPGVRDVHDLHVWTITSGMESLSVHVVVDPEVDQHAMLHRLEDLLRDHFAIDHLTIQIDLDHTRGLAIAPRLSAPEQIS
jgi:cobalt-zinc-cadmium efflux system protein